MIFGGILIASLCWALTFGFQKGDFWIKIALSVISVSLYSSIFERPKISFQIKSILWGIISAWFLYLIFLTGDRVSPFFLSGSKAQIENIYLLGAETNKVFIFFILLFVTGPGEEIFWRGFLQKHLMDRYGSSIGYFTTTAIYAGVHIFSMNLILMLAAFIAGAFWGILYLWKRDLLLQICSHSIWSIIIFIFLPIK